MPYCGYCGKELAEGAKFCPSCGAPIVVETAPQVPPRQVPERKRPSHLVARPVGISVLAFLEAIVSLFTLIGGIALNGLAVFLAAGGWGVIPQQELERAFREMPWAQAFAGVQLASLTTAVLMAIGVIVLLIAIVGLVMAWGLWAAKRWARTVTMVLAAISILSGIFSLPGSIISILIYAAIIYYLTRPHVKAYYNR